MTKFHKLQPKDGDVVLSCGHRTQRYHWFKAEGPPFVFVRPDGTTGVAEWIICCDGCYVQHGAEPQKIKIRGDGVWQGDAPVISAGS